MPKGDDIIDITVGKRGPESDITLFRVQRNNFSKKQLFEGDKTYIGEENILTPHKKPKNGELTVLQKEENRVFSSSRIFIEHLISKDTNLFHFTDQISTQISLLQRSNTNCLWPSSLEPWHT